MATITVALGDRLPFTEIVGLAAVRASEAEFWPRWILASVALHFNARRRGLPMFLEGEDHLDHPQPSSWIEVRVDGPFIREPSQGFYDLLVEVNVLVVTSKNDQDLYNHIRNVGTISQAFLTPIQVLKCGDGIDDDSSLLGCMVLVRSENEREALRSSHFGQLDAVTPLLRSSIEGHYLLQLHG